MDYSRMPKVQTPIADISLRAAKRLDGLMSNTPGMDTAMKVELRVKAATGRSVGHSTIRRIRRGLVNPTISNLHDIALAFGLHASDLLDDGTTGVQEPRATYQARSPTYEKILALIDGVSEPELLMALGAVRAALDGHQGEGSPQKKPAGRAG